MSTLAISIKLSVTLGLFVLLFASFFHSRSALWASVLVLGCLCVGAFSVQAQEQAEAADPIASLPAPPEETSPVLPSQEPSVDAPATTPTPTPITAPVVSTPPVLNVVPDGESLRAIVDRQHLALPLKEARIVIDKSERRLDLLSGSTLVKSYRVALGSNPVGAKTSQGDGRTPEGRFYICTRNAKSSAFHIFMGLSYPALPDAKRAVNDQQISWREYQIIHQRLASRGRPPWETNLGGWVGIHGGTEDAFAQKKMKQRGSRDWTAGCIALTNREIAELYAATRLGTPVEVKE